MAEFQINHEDLTGLKGKVVIITGMPDRPMPFIEGILARRIYMAAQTDRCMENP